MAASKPVVLLFSLSDFRMDDMDAHLLKHLRTESQVQVISSWDAALQWLSKNPRPQAILLTDEVVTERRQEALLKKLAEYTKAGGTIVFGCRFSTFVKAKAMENMFQRTLGLPWARGSYHRTTFSLNKNVENISTNTLSSSYSMKAMHLQNVAPTAAVYLPSEASRIESHVFAPTPITKLEETPAAFAKVGLGYVGFVGDVNEEEPTTHLLIAMLLASSAAQRDTGSSTSRNQKNVTRSSILILSLHKDDHFDSLNAGVYAALRSRADVTEASTEREALNALTASLVPSAVLVTDAGVMDEDYSQVLLKLLAYIQRRESTTVFACQFSSFVRWPDLDALFKRLGLVWRSGSYTKMDVTVTKAVDDVDFDSLIETHEYPKALFLQDVPWEESVYVPTLQYRSKETMAAFGWTERGGRVGYVGDVNPSENMTKLIVALCFPKTSPVSIETPPEPQAIIPPSSPTSREGVIDSTTRPAVLLISFDKVPSFEGTEKQLFSALKRNALVLQSSNADTALKHLFRKPSPAAVFLTHPGFVHNEQIVQRLVEYAREGGRVVLGSQFSTHLQLDEFKPFFHKWNLPWDSGAYHRTTVALNPAGIPSTLQPSKLFDAYSMKAVHLKNVKSKHKVYVPTSGSCVETPSGEPGQPVSGSLLNECPAAWVPVGKGYLGYIGDVNSEEESTRLALEMCGITIKPGDLGPRTWDVGVSIGAGQVTPISETCAERHLPVYTKRAQLRSREKEVAVRSVKRANNSRRKRLVAERLKEEGNKFFKQGKSAQAASRYRQAALVYGPRPVYMSNLAAALLKMGRDEEAEAAATRVLFYDPKNVKARYRRGMARKSLTNYDEAIDDFKSALKLDPSSAASRTALEETVRLYSTPPQGSSDAVGSEEEEPLWEIMTDSDSSEFENEGNGTPCRYMNHDGCRHGSDCRWKHAPDDRSVRDQLGRNVCIVWLLGQCIVGKKCWYAHDKAYLPQDGWWNKPDQLKRLADELKFSLTGHQNTDRALFVASIHTVRNWRRDVWVSERFSDLDDETIYVPGQSRGISFNTMRYNGDDSDDYDDAYDEELAWVEGEERMSNFGFTHDEVQELLAQGVKPWDDDAWDVMGVLCGM